MKRIPIITLCLSLGSLAADKPGFPELPESPVTLIETLKTSGEPIRSGTNSTPSAAGWRARAAMAEAGLPPEVAKASAAFKTGWQARYPEDYAVSRTLLSWMKTGMKMQEVERLLGPPDGELDGGWHYTLYYSMQLEVRFGPEGTVVQVSSPLLPRKAELDGVTNGRPPILPKTNGTLSAAGQVADFHLVQTQVRDAYAPGVPLESLTVYVLVFTDRSPQVFRMFGSKPMEKAIGTLPRGSVLQYDGNALMPGPVEAQIQALTACCRKNGIRFILGPTN